MKISKNVLFGLTFLLLIFICVFIILKQDGKVANIYYDGNLYASVDLSKTDEPCIIDIDGKNTALAENGKIRMRDATCPDGLCVKQGEISDGGYPIVCLPNKVIIRIEDE